jgi:hypothetical protein
LSTTDQRELASQYCAEIDEYLKQLEGNDSSKREKILTDVNRLTIFNAILPFVLAAISAGAFILSQQVATVLINLGNVIPPILINNSKARMRHYNDCADLQTKFTGFKGQINRLASLGQLKDDKLMEIDETLKGFNKALADYLQIIT